MDLHFTADQPDAAERQAVDSVLGPAAETVERFAVHRGRPPRHLLLPVLHAIQSRVGWLSPGALNYACGRLELPPAEGFAVASFYGLFSVAPRPPVVLHVCDDIGCRARGAEELCSNLEAKLGAPGEQVSDGQSTWLRSACLGLCERAPAALMSAAGETPFEKVYAPADSEALIAAIGDPQSDGAPDVFDAKVSTPQAPGSGSRLLRRIGVVDPESLDSYRAHGGYAALRRAFEIGPPAVVRELRDSKLVGRGGAAFPTGRKWDPANRPYYLVCNADESEPGAFKDRVIMEGDPFSLVEAVTLAGFATGCRKAFIYVRGEYPLCYERLAHALDAVRRRGLLGEAIMGREFSFDIELRRGAGAYVCGEETALFNSIEGFRGEPRNKPPFPTEAGLFGKPTIVNNVETLINLLDIVMRGGSEFAATGTAGSTGTKLFCLSGHVQRPGVYEAPFGTTVREIIELAGGVSGSGRLQTVLLGGAAGTFISPAELDTPLTFEGTRAIGAALGSGVVMLFDDTVDLRSMLLRISAFFRDESCGQCVPCRMGTVRQEEALQRLSRNVSGDRLESDLSLLADVGQVMRDSSICGLGQMASMAVESALARGLVKQWEVNGKG
jgi:NADH-quinone oxidoreductase subunit F